VLKNLAMIRLFYKPCALKKLEDPQERGCTLRNSPKKAKEQNASVREEALGARRF
jgi:hypothetical protein